MILDNTQQSVRGVTDASNALIEADQLLLDLHLACGGEPGGTLAVPELLGLILKAREYGFTLSRRFRAVTRDDVITAWAKLTPHASGDAGCDLVISQWKVDRAPVGESASTHQIELARSLAECTIRLDDRQRVISIDTDASDLDLFEKRIKEAPQSNWRDLVDVTDDHVMRPDGSNERCHLPGSERTWTAILDKRGPDESKPDGFVLYLDADRPFSEANHSGGHNPPSLGRDLTPVLRQPVNRIIANAETIRTRLAGPLKDEYSDYAADIASAGQHLLALIDDLADLEVVEADDFTTAPDRIDLADVARRACGILGVRAKERGIVLDAPVEGEQQLAVAEFRRVLQVLLNLIGNAIRYAPENSRVWVRLDAVEDRALVTVADQGHGLDAEQQAKVFEKFERLGRGDDGGSGLGLYISRRIARALGGDLTVESAPGQGARFTLSVPAATALNPSDIARA